MCHHRVEAFRLVKKDLNVQSTFPVDLFHFSTQGLPLFRLDLTVLVLAYTVALLHRFLNIHHCKLLLFKYSIG